MKKVSKKIVERATKELAKAKEDQETEKVKVLLGLVEREIDVRENDIRVRENLKKEAKTEIKGFKKVKDALLSGDIEKAHKFCSELGIDNLDAYPWF